MAVGDAHVFPGFLTPVLTQISFQCHGLLFQHASAELRGENTPKKKVASTGYRTRNHQLMSPTRSPLSHLGAAAWGMSEMLEVIALENSDTNTHERTYTEMTLLLPCIVSLTSSWLDKKK